MIPEGAELTLKSIKLHGEKVILSILVVTLGKVSHLGPEYP